MMHRSKVNLMLPSIENDGLTLMQHYLSFLSVALPTGVECWLSTLSILGQKKCLLNTETTLSAVDVDLCIIFAYCKFTSNLYCIISH